MFIRIESARNLRPTKLAVKYVNFRGVMGCLFSVRQTVTLILLMPRTYSKSIFFMNTPSNNLILHSENGVVNEC